VKGITLVEVLVTVLVVSIGLLGLAGLQAASTQYNHSSYMRTHANNMAYDIADRMRGNRPAALAGDYNGSWDTDSPPSASGTVPEDELNQWWTSLAATLPDPEAAIVVDGSGEAQITIEWLDDRGEDERTEFELETRI